MMAAVGGLLAVGVSGIGLASSYRALERKAAASPTDGGWGWESPWMLPVGLDMSILAFSIINLVLIKADRPLAWVKWIPRLGAVATIYLNWQSAAAGPSQFGHAVLIALWVFFSEIAAHLYAAHIGAVKGRVRMEGVRLSRWLLDPASTAVMARQMKLWEITSYERALKIHKDRQVYKQGLTQRYGRRWRWKERHAAAPTARRSSALPGHRGAGRAGEGGRCGCRTGTRGRGTDAAACPTTGGGKGYGDARGG